MIKSNHNKQMLHNIEQSKRFLTQVERVGKIERGGNTNSNIDNDITTDKETKVNKKDVIKKKKFEDILKQYNKKENNINNVRNDGKKNKKTKKKIYKIFKKKKKTCHKKKMIIYYLNIKNCKKLAERLSCKAFYYDVGNKKKFLEGFINGKQQTVVAINAFGMGINVADIRVIVHANESRTMLDYAQESG